MGWFPAISLSLTLLLACGKEELVFRENIGRVAFDGTTGVEIGKIVSVERLNGTWVYQVEREGRIINLPVTNLRIAEGTTTERATAAKPSTPTTIDPSVRATGDEFMRRLGRSNAKLTTLTFASNTMTASWTSPRCSTVEGEIIDLLLSVNRTRTESPSIEANVRCEEQTQEFALSGADFQRYRSGQINDAAVLRGIQRR